MENKKVLIMIPAFNEGRAIRLLVNDIRKRFPAFTILVINDGSSDNTAQEARAGKAQLVSLPYNLGIGGAVQTGFKLALRDGYDATIQIDGDAQHDPAFLMDVLGPVLRGEVDLCIGSRFLSEKSKFKSTFLRRIGIRFFSVLLGWLTGIYLTDPTSGYRATGKKLISKFASYYPIDFPEPEAIQIANRFGAKIIEVPVNMRKRLGGTSSIRYFVTLYYMIKVTLAILIDTLKHKN
ncbi:MAG: glycosyltransferase family 2 protein [Candidatus Omnitrophica bacterium]|nr:glycosyltransferase family 2 protein [Candidatus Omnitrophota bacterium]